ncbi:hypothetical protein FC093_09945 [Ilyomonas limi]|uniref:Uncharacterized protein n=1 Tax=Ilyomonas limi TaxID=2575867 RepID=A0A4U3L3W6_9BACT|nr:hypothetical protein [Ilyomonas limi]TKK69004.1 hypothetical protein FC093_09945 [Ilyomonas limi]
MKKLSIFLPILFVVTLVFANRLFSGSDSKLVNKEVDLAIFTDNNYDYAAYDSSLAQVEITVQRVSGNASYTAFTKTYDAMQLKQYATEKNALTEKMNIQAVKDDKEILVVTYAIAYNTKGSKLIIERKEVIGRGEVQKKIDVVI